MPTSRQRYPDSMCAVGGACEGKVRITAKRSDALRHIGSGCCYGWTARAKAQKATRGHLTMRAKRVQRTCDVDQL